MDIIEHERRKYRLRVKGTSFAQIAKELGVAKTNVSAVSRGVKQSARIRQAIADALGEPVESIFLD